ncbi:MAG: restriction endonuclease [Deltaproteobacteria bacterium CG2_30_63_29]|nr:MAG: restriction endonuclease [Deltaproteobacteria bacterium CG2_30_63_29]
MRHHFTQTIVDVLERHFRGSGEDVLASSSLLQYLNVKTRSANRGSKSRGSFANHYALYVLVEDYISGGFADQRSGEYSKYEGARFTDLFRRQRELPFGSKLQNHALNSRLNDEFAKYFPTLEQRPILRDLKEQRYWINEALLEVASDGRVVNIAKAVIEIVDAYVDAKRSAFESFLSACRSLSDVSADKPDEVTRFVTEQLQPNVDARVFEIVSYAILKAHFGDKSIFWGWTADELKEEYLVLYKTGRTNANDGGIDFVMRPLGRFFQVTETIDANKYFLDIDKVQRFPLTFVVKTNETPESVSVSLREQAFRKYRVQAVVDRYLDCIEEIINIPTLVEIFGVLSAREKLQEIMEEVVLQSMVEFNYDEPDEDADA